MIFYKKGQAVVTRHTGSRNELYGLVVMRPGLIWQTVVQAPAFDGDLPRIHRIPRWNLFPVDEVRPFIAAASELPDLTVKRLKA